MMKKLLTISFLLVLTAARLSAVDIYDRPEYASTAYFGPNAFPVPQIADGTSGSICAELSGDFIRGRVGEKDFTYDVNAALSLPLFTDRVNLRAWWTVHEWYEMSRDVMDFRHIGTDIAGTSDMTGALYVSTDILVLEERARVPSLTVRAAMRTATEKRGAYEAGRGYDAAGYFFDAALGKNFGPFRITLSTGFLCWQVGPGKQNDAVMYGIKASYSCPFLRMSAHFGGYSGWRNCGDRPMTLRVQGDMGLAAWPVLPFLEYQRGFRDWQFDQLRLGLKLNVF